MDTRCVVSNPPQAAMTVHPGALSDRQRALNIHWLAPDLLSRPSIFAPATRHLTRQTVVEAPPDRWPPYLQLCQVTVDRLFPPHSPCAALSRDRIGIPQDRGHIAMSSRLDGTWLSIPAMPRSRPFEVRLLTQVPSMRRSAETLVSRLSPRNEFVSGRKHFTSSLTRTTSRGLPAALRRHARPTGGRTGGIRKAPYCCRSGSEVPAKLRFLLRS